MYVIKRSELAFDVVKGTPDSVGYDLTSPHDYTIRASGKELVETYLTFVFPEGYYGKLADRSSMAWKNFISVMGGVIDSDYRGTIKVILHNHSNEDYHIKRGDKIAQLILHKSYSDIQVLHIDSNTKLHEDLDTIFNDPNNKRKEGGFGSTGK